MKPDFGGGYNHDPRPSAPVMGGRLLYRPADVLPWIAGKTVALIGDGESKRRYIFAPEAVTTFAINKAALWYPRDIAVVVMAHFDEIMIQLPPWVAILYFGPVDIRRYNIHRGLWTAITTLGFLAEHAATVYLQGLSLSRPKYQDQMPLYRQIQGRAKAQIVNLGGGPLDEVWPPVLPPSEVYC